MERSSTPLRGASRWVAFVYRKFRWPRFTKPCHWSARGGPTLKRARQRRGRTAPKCWTNAAFFIGRESLGKQSRVAPLSSLTSVGLDYLTLDRRANATLSGGESQRIRLATQIGSRLTGVMYVLDEPSIGLHQRDNERLLETLRELSDLGNTLGGGRTRRRHAPPSRLAVRPRPGSPGLEGGAIVANGPPQRGHGHGRVGDRRPPRAVGEATRGSRKAHESKARHPRLVLKGAAHNNLQSIDVDVPLGLLTTVTGVSGSGKSSSDFRVILAPALQRRTCTTQKPCRGSTRPSKARKKWTKPSSSPSVAHRAHALAPIPATYTKVFDEIRSLFAKIPRLQRSAGYTARDLPHSTSREGRCEACKGGGRINRSTREMNFLPDVWHHLRQLRQASGTPPGNASSKSRGEGQGETIQRRRRCPSVRRGGVLRQPPSVDPAEPSQTLSLPSGWIIFVLAANLATTLLGRRSSACEAGPVNWRRPTNRHTVLPTSLTSRPRASRCTYMQKTRGRPA